MKVAHEAVIRRPPPVVFPWLVEPEKASQWQQDVVAWEVIELQPGMVGTTFRETVEENGKQLDMLGSITQYKENELIAFHLDSRIHTLDVSYSLQADEEGARIYIETDIRWKFPMNLVGLFMGRRMREELTRQLSQELSELKALCENQD